jgi:hypothetical protein
MRDIQTEARKHFGFFLTCASILLGIFALKELIDSYKTVLDVIWVFCCRVGVIWCRVLCRRADFYVFSA